jgi:hypothetical protein
LTDPRLEFDALFTDQVESQHRDWALAAGQHALACYKLSGAYDDLLVELKVADSVTFESRVGRTVAGVPLHGRPDCRYSLHSLAIVLDWKVCGFCSQDSPSPGYLLCRDGWVGKASRSHNTSHKLAMPTEYRGQKISAGDLDSDYTDQLSIYAWLTGSEPGDEEAVLAIDELACKAMPSAAPAIRVAQHRSRSRRAPQMALLAEIKEVWRRIHSGEIFDELSPEENAAYCDSLNRAASEAADDEFCTADRRSKMF